MPGKIPEGYSDHPYESDKDNALFPNIYDPDLMNTLRVAKADGPFYYLWVFDPQEDKIIVEHNESRPPHEHIDHGHLAERVPHPARVHGYAYRIRGGWRISDDNHRPVDDPHVKALVKSALNS